MTADPFQRKETNLKYSAYLLLACAVLFVGIGSLELYPLALFQMGVGAESSSVNVNKGALSLVLGGYCLLRAYLIRKEAQKKAGL